MIRTPLLTICAAAILSITPLCVLADHKEYQGRTGLPTVLEGKDKVWMEKGLAALEVRGNDLWVTQDVKMRYPGPDVEKNGTRIKVAVREDYYRSKDGGAGDVSPAEAKGFRSFNVTIDGRKAASSAEPWTINDKNDTATRWRTVWVDFRPGQVRQMRIVSAAPIGRDGNHRIVEFRSKDVGHWRESPDYLEIRFKAPGSTEAVLAGLEPKPNDQNRRAVRWVYRKASPNRDIFIMLPDSYPARSRTRS